MIIETTLTSTSPAIEEGSGVMKTLKKIVKIVGGVIVTVGIILLALLLGWDRFGCTDPQRGKA